MTSELPEKRFGRVDSIATALVSKGTQRDMYDRLSLEQDRPQMRDFLDVYSAQEIATDTKRVEQLERKFGEDIERMSAHSAELSAEAREQAEVAETLLAKLAELNNWLGDQVFVHQTSKFDDLERKTDMVVEFDPEDVGKQLGISLDLTFGTQKASNKLGSISDTLNSDISKERLGKSSVKYFNPEFKGNKKGQLEVVPVVIGIDFDRANDLIEKYTSEKRLAARVKENPKDGTAAKLLSETRKEIEASPIRKIILREIIAQLDMFIRTGSRLHFPGDKIESMKKMREMLFAHLESLGENPAEDDEIQNDTVFNHIMFAVSQKR
ncbi:MAG: hypothetical protein WC797_00355 [Candidatus Paceibacterota bacterium]